MAAKTLIKGGAVITADPEIGNLESGDILIEDGRITQVGPSIEAGDAEVIDARGHIVAPGFIDGHRHLWEVLLKEVGVDWSTANYYHGVRGIFAQHYDAEDMHTANLLGACEALDAGVTTILDCCHNLNTPEHADAAIAGLREAGIRAAFAHGNSNDDWVPLVNDSMHSDDARRVQREHFSDPDDLLTMMLCLRGPQWAPRGVVEDEFAMAREMGIRITFPVGMGKWAQEHPIEMIEDMGLAGGDITYSHANVLTERELEIIARTGASVAMTPEREMNGGAGAVAPGVLMEHGIRPSLGMDLGPQCAGDLFSAMRHTLAAERSRQHTLARAEGRENIHLHLTCQDVVEFATIEGARACGIDDRVGSLTPGKEADLMIVRGDTWSTGPLNNPLGALVFFASRADVDTVMVRGRLVKKDGRLCTVDAADVLGRAKASRDKIFSRADMRPGSFDWRLDSKEWTATVSRAAASR